MMKSETTPSLSVLIANYNHAQFVGQQLLSLLNQSLQPIEIIVIDDGSTDDSVSVIEQFSKTNPVIKFHKNDGNKGVVYTVNKALQMAIGDYVGFLSADDPTLPGFLEKSMALLCRYPMAGLCCSDPAQMDMATGQVENNHLGISAEPTYISPSLLLKLLKKKYFNIAGHTSIIRKAAVIEAGNLTPELKWYCDWFVYYVISFRYGLCYIPESLAVFRISKNSYSAEADRLSKEKREVITHMLYLLHRPSFQDVLPFFRESAVFSIFGWPVISILRAYPEFRGMRTLTLIRRCFMQEVKKRTRAITPISIRNAYRRLRQNRK